MAFPTILYGPESEVYNTYAAVSPAPGDNGSGGQIAQRGRLPLGQQLVLADGRKFRFALAGATTLVVGNMVQAPAAVATDEDLTPAAGAINDRIITFTHGAATTVINIFAEGSGVISVTPGGGDAYKIASHAALRNATAGDVINLAPGQALRRAITTTSRLDLSQHPYGSVVQTPVTTITGVPVGAVIAAITNAQFGWLQTRGLGGVLTSGTLVRGTRCVVPAGAAGAVAPETAVVANVNIEITVGTVHAVAATTAWSTIFLQID